MARKRSAPAPELAANLAGLVQACKEEPDDDGLRLILADYLEDHGEPERAEFIRLSLQVDRPKVEPASCAAIHARLAQLRHLHGDRWLGPLVELKGSVGFRRGMIEVHARMQEFRRPRVVADLEAVHPWTDRVWLQFGRQPLPAEFANLPCAGAFTHLDLSRDELAREYLAGVARSVLAPRLIGLRVRPRATSRDALMGLFDAQSNLTSLRSLSIWGGVSAIEMRALTAAPFASRLRALTLTGADLSADTLRILAGADSLAGLERLEIACSFDSEDGIGLANAPDLRRLRTLRVRGCYLADAFGVALGRSPVLASVRVLDLETNDFTDATLTALAESPHVANLEELDLQGNAEITDVGVQALAASPYLANLRRLNLAWTNLRLDSLGADSAQALARSPNLRKLETLSLNGNRRIGAAGLKALCRSEHLLALRDLDVERTGMTHMGLAMLADGPLAASLRRLRLAEQKLGPETAEFLAGSAAFQNLEALELRFVRIENRGLRALAESNTLERLAWLMADLNPHPEEGIAALADRTGLPALTFLILGGEQSQFPRVLRPLQISPRNRNPFFVAGRYSFRDPLWLSHATPGFPAVQQLE